MRNISSSYTYFSGGVGGQVLDAPKNAFLPMYLNFLFSTLQTLQSLIRCHILGISSGSALLPMSLLTCFQPIKCYLQAHLQLILQRDK